LRSSLGSSFLPVAPSRHAKLLIPRLRIRAQTYKTTVDTVIPAVVPALKAKGFKLVSMAECLGQSAYQSTGTAGKRDSTWTCSGTPAPGKT